MELAEVKHLSEIKKELERRRRRAAGAEREGSGGRAGWRKGERDARAKEKGEAQKTVEELKNRCQRRPLSWRRKKGEGFGAERVKALEGEVRCGNTKLPLMNRSETCSNKP